MNRNYSNNWQQVVIVAVSLFLGLPVFFTSEAIASSVNLNGSQLSSQAGLSEPSSELHIAQDLNTCYRVTAESGLYVREEPDVYSEAISVLRFGQNVTIAPGGTENWVPILAPLRGYVWADWLAPC